MIDITDRKAAEEALRESEERFRTLVDGAPDGVFVHSGDRLEFANKALCRMLGVRSVDELIGMSVMDLVAPEYRHVVRERMEALQATGVLSPLEHEYVRPDGSRISVEATAVELGERGSGTHLVFLRDITDRKAAEADRENLRRQLQHSQKMESVGQLAGGVAHDFNNILMVQKGYCEMMRGALRPGDPLAQDLAQIEACTERAAALTKQLLAFSRKQTLQPRLLDLNVVVSDLGDVLRRLLGEDMELVISPAPQPELVKADPGQLEQVLVNLAVNARDAMAGGGRLAIVVSHAWLDRPQGGPDKGFAPGTYVSVSLTDTGCGMDEETQSRAFEPFFTTKPEGKGTGLGLAMVHGIVHQSGGDIAMSSTLGQGTSFTLYLPACEERPAQREAAVESAVERGTAELILVVEDERALRRLAVTMLEKLGYRATAADSGEMALTLVEGEGVRPDLVLTDLVMPGIRGGLLVKRLRETLPDLKIVYMSGYADDSLGEEAGSTHFLHKPFSLAGLSAVVKAALDEPRLS
jgi:PAS domain S-box-containing protein